jgi:RNA polymerase sigma-70 factor (ECF subfamily)
VTSANQSSGTIVLTFKGVNMDMNSSYSSADIYTDAVLVSMFKAGDIKAYEELISRYTEKVFRLAMRFTRQLEDSEEVVQDVCISVFRKIQEFEEKSAFSSWLYRITANAALMKLRKRKKHSAIELDEVVLSSQEKWNIQRSDSSDVDYLSTRHELKAALLKAIARLPEEYKKIFIMRDVDGHSNQEVGDCLDISLAAVKSRLHRARMYLRRELSEHRRDGLASEESDEENGISQVD